MGLRALEAGGCDSFVLIPAFECITLSPLSTLARLPLIDDSVLTRFRGVGDCSYSDDTALLLAADISISPREIN